MARSIPFYRRLLNFMSLTTIFASGRAPAKTSMRFTQSPSILGLALSTHPKRASSPPGTTRSCLKIPTVFA
ncbi:MAG TPA: hypothetical protein EYG46_04440 [Myxococcales bacterium]|nr:hypothetical protein [Myxococcales bacterium]